MIFRFMTCRTLVFAAVTALQASAALRVSLTPSLASPQPLGTSIEFSATAKDTSSGELDYRFRAGLSGQPLRVIKDFQPDDVLDWTQSLREGQYRIEVTARNQSTHEQATALQTFRVSPRATRGFAVITPTHNRLVFVYSAPACTPGSSMRVRFWTGNEAAQYTPYQNCEAGLTNNFFIAGLRASTEYQATHEIKTGEKVVSAKEMTFTTHTLPANFRTPALTIKHPLDAAGCQAQPILLQQYFATDLQGRVVWYDPSGRGIDRVLSGGGLGLGPDGSLLRQIDLAGNVIRETTPERVSEQLIAMGQDPILEFHHDVILLPNGHLMTLGNIRRVLKDVQGPGAVPVIGDVLIELDENLQVVWTWNEFDHLDVRRKAINGDVCAPGRGGCPRLPPGDRANDWTHSNSVAYTRDANLIVSVRSQDWVIKIDYQQGKGSGRILWRLGKDGDFKLISSDPNGWFSGEHDVEFDPPDSATLSLFDNGNTRHASDPMAHSRGQVYLLDEARHTATLQLSTDLGVYSNALGSAQRLCNGGYSFNAGNIQGIPGVNSRTTEVLPDGSPVYTVEHAGATYRSFRMKSMYEQ